MCVLHVATSGKMINVTEKYDEDEQAEFNRYMVFGAYGALMLDFQSLELDLWQFLMVRIKPGAPLEAWSRKMQGWNAQTLGSIYGSIKAQGHLPQSIADELDGAVEFRNYLAHRFLIEWAIVVPSVEVRDAALEVLAKISDRLEVLKEALTAHLRTQGWDPEAELNTLDEETLREIEAMRPTRWPIEPPTTE
jgi:hypothetical protein